MVRLKGGGQRKRPIPEEAIRLRGDHPSRFRWPGHLARLLGRVSDVALAKRVGLTARAVAAERRRRSIACSVHLRPAVIWPPSAVRLLGQVPDADVARQLGVHPSTVMNKRRSLGIVSYGGEGYGHRAYKWTGRTLRLLGELSDAQVARRLGIARTTVKLKRRELGIEARGPAPVRWTAEMKALLGKESDPRVARRLGIAVRTAARQRVKLGIAPHGKRCCPLVRGPELRELLATMSGAELKQRYGIAEITLLKLRRELKVPAPPPKSRKGVRTHRWRAEDLKLLSADLPDKEIAAQVGVSEAAVRQQRHFQRQQDSRR